jgi:hypothetical protein
MTDEELISYRDDVREFMIAENEADTRIFQDVSKELISRLARGGKAIEAMGKIIASRETFLKSQMSVIGETDIPAEIFIEEVHSIIETFQDNPNGH